ncbi:MAG: hypothetical protein OXG35_13475 [Acidobacteria bacterium]|nr:hypothetical protein [Acidobacteriota bacterium]
MPEDRPWACADDELYDCTHDCPQGPVHGPDGCDACHNRDAPYVIKFAAWTSAYCERCARQLRLEGYELSRDGKALPDDDDARVPGMGDQGEQLTLALDHPQHTG